MKCPICNSDLNETMSEYESVPNSVSITTINTGGCESDDLSYEPSYDASDFEGKYYCCWCETILSL